MLLAKIVDLYPFAPARRRIASAIASWTSLSCSFGGRANGWALGTRVLPTVRTHGISTDQAGVEVGYDLHIAHGSIGKHERLEAAFDSRS